jgi:hypothetical protein
MPSKKKNAVAPLKTTNTENEVNPLETSVPPPEPEKKAKRERKSTKHKVVAIVGPDGIQGNFQAEAKRPLIAHLPIHSSEVVFHDQPLVYDPRPPIENPEGFSETTPYNDDNTYEPESENIVIDKNVQEVLNKRKYQEEMYRLSLSVEKNIEPIEECSTILEPLPVISKIEEVVVHQPYTPKDYGNCELLVCYKGSRQTQYLPNSSGIACFWCCDTFTGGTCIIPKEVLGNVWQVYGNFCSPQCALAYLLSELLDTHVRWERISLLQRLYGSQCTHGRVYPAPSRETLQRFGGPVSSQDFHAMCDKQRIRIDVHMPPMVSILPTMDTKPIDFYETNVKNSVPSVAATMKEEGAGLKLKRSKPLKEHENTLDSILQFRSRN